MDLGKAFDGMERLLGDFPNRVNVLEEGIDLKTQFDYLRRSRQMRIERAKKLKEEAHGSYRSLSQLADELNLEHIDDQQRRDLLIEIASTEDPAAYDLLKNYRDTASEPLRAWATLALYETRMLLETELLDQNQVYVSTGLGGRDNKLRYSVAFAQAHNQDLNQTQQQVIANELDFGLPQAECELEALHFDGPFAMFRILAPMATNIKQMLGKLLDECNLYGNFLDKQLVVTNVRDIDRAMLEQMRQPESESDQDQADQADEQNALPPRTAVITTNVEPNNPMNDLVEKLRRLIQEKLTELNIEVRDEQQPEADTDQDPE